MYHYFIHIWLSNEVNSDLNINDKKIKLLEENIRKKLQDTEEGRDFINGNKKSQLIKRTSLKLITLIHKNTKIVKGR